jgi:hypothetical protein
MAMLIAHLYGDTFDSSFHILMYCYLSFYFSFVEIDGNLKVQISVNLQYLTKTFKQNHACGIWKKYNHQMYF